MSKNSKKFIFWFAQENVNFRRNEIESLAKLFNIELNYLKNLEPEKPFWIVESNENDVKKIASRSVSLRSILELWSHSTDIDEIHKNIQNYLNKNEIEVQKYFKPDVSFKITIETYNKHFSHKEKVEKIEYFDYLPVKGYVNLKDPDVNFWYIEYYGLNPKEVPEKPKDVLFGRWLIDGQRQLIKNLSLKNRKFIGNTSMDPQLSLLMANQALIKEGDFVFDPFVGTGSLLVSAAKFGGFVLGADIDFLMLHARDKPSRIKQKVRDNDESVQANLKQYNVENRYIDVIVTDFSNPIWRSDIQFDAIITDPPYGIREAMEKIDSKPVKKSSKPAEDAIHYPSTSHYSLNHIYDDLLQFSFEHLKLNGRLVCWFPYHKEDYSYEMIPQHKKMILVGNSEQPLSGFISRKLLTYEKISNFAGDDDKIVTKMIGNFREKYFAYDKETRQEKRIRRAELRELGKIEAIKRGKKLDEKGKVIKEKKDLKNYSKN